MTTPPFGPRPIPTDLSAPYWQGAADGRLLVQRCQACARHVFIPAIVCPYCTSDDLTWTQSTGRGVVHSVTVVHRPPNPSTPAPYAVAVIELAEGWHMLSNVIGCAVDAVTIGMEVEAVFLPLDAHVGLPLFKPAGSDYEVIA
jgi:uncharacterized OB-fold protein